MALDLARLLDTSKLATLSKLYSAIGILIIAFFALLILKYVYHHVKIKPKEKAVGNNLQVLIAGFLDRIYDAYKSKGIKLDRFYPKSASIHIRERKTFGMNAWLLRPNKPEQVKQGDIGRIFVERLFIWRKEDRIRIAALLAAWWFNVQYYTVEGKPLGPLSYTINPSKLPKLRRMCMDTLKFAGIHEAAEPSSAGSADVVKLITKADKEETEHRRIAQIEHEDIIQIERLVEKEQMQLGKPHDVHKTAKVMDTHIAHLIMLGHEQVKLLKNDAGIRKALGEEKCEAEYRTLLEDIARLETYIDWLQKAKESDRQDPAARKELAQRLKLFDQTVIDVSSRLMHLDQMMEGGA